MKEKTFLKLLCWAIAAGLLFSSVALAQEKAGKKQEAYAGADAGVEEHDWMDQLKNPAPWFKWGFDQRLRTIYADNFLTLDRDVHGHRYHFQRFRSRLWGTLTPTENVEINTRLTWEWRNWCAPHTTGFDTDSNVEFDEALFDKMNVNFKKIFDSSVDLKVGRQDIILGNGWLVLDGTPMDGSRTIFFDAIRTTYTIDESNKIELMYIDQQSEADETIKPFNDQEREVGLMEQDERGAILYWTNKSIIPKSQLDGFLIWKYDMPISGVGTTSEANIFAFGLRTAGKFDDNWKYRAEFAQELGHKKTFLGDYADLCAFGFNSRLSYHLNDEKKNEVHADYEYLSGDDPSTDTNEQFDPLWARWPRWSENYIYTYAMETRIAESTNLHRAAVGWSASPVEKIQLCLDYHLLFAAENTRKDNPTVISFSDSGSFRGQLATARLKYKYNEHLSGHVVGEFFFPGNYYSGDNDHSSMFLRYELMLTF